ncbi:MAG: PcfJ domain-containing protein [Candidatus Thiodiazotropha taylori]
MAGHMPRPYDPTDPLEVATAWDEELRAKWQNDEWDDELSKDSDTHDISDKSNIIREIHDDPQVTWHQWIEADGSFIARISETPRYLRILPWDMGCMGMHYGISEEWVNPQMANEVEWNWKVRLNNIDIISLLVRYSASNSSFIEKIPRKVRKNLGNYQYLQLEMLKLAGTYTAACQLAETNPALLWLITSFVSSENSNISSLGDLFLHKQQQIVKVLLDRSVSKSQIRLLKKYQAKHGKQLTLNDLVALRRLLKEGDRPSLRHWPIITSEIVAMVRRYGEQYIRCLYPLVHEHHVADWSMLIYDFTQLWCDTWEQCSGNTERIQIFWKVDSATKLQALHQRWIDEDHRILRMQNLQSALSEEELSEAFPVLNFNSSLDSCFTRLDTPYALYRESFEMGHCVSNFVLKAKREGRAFFSVITPDEERLTLDIQWENKQWKIRELKGVRNRVPSFSEHDLVERWLKTVNQSIEFDFDKYMSNSV